MHQLNVRQSVDPGYLADAGASGHSNCIPGAPLECGNVGRDHALDAATSGVERSGGKGGSRSVTEKTLAQFELPVQRDRDLPNQTDACNLRSTDRHILLTIACKRAELDEWGIIVEQEFDAVSGLLDIKGGLSA